MSVGKVRQQFDKFVKMKGVKRVIAFGGWTASTDPSSYWIFREGVKSANRQTLANNLVKFAKDNNLDGIDIDWEYPGAPDIDGIPAGDPLDGEAYLALLKLIKAQLPSKSWSMKLHDYMSISTDDCRYYDAFDCNSFVILVPEAVPYGRNRQCG